ncbi:MAG: sugar ABC transporter permease [Clostridia bacterium]|nr:sugar ABC transporter permease [Clostridia bacterium]
MIRSAAAPRRSLLARSKIRETWPMHLMMLGPVIMIFIFAYVPMVGIVIAFQDYIPTKGFFGSEWINFENFEYMFMLPDIWQIIGNTLIISVLKIVTTIGASIIFALLISEVKSKTLNKVSQSVILFPWFISWVILGNIFKDAFGLNGMVNQLIKSLGGNEVFFFGENGLFRGLLIGTNIWKDLGYNMVILLTAISGIDPTLYEAATIDGANKFQQKLKITLPSIMPMIVLLFTLALGGILNAGFEQVLVLYNNAVLDSSEILDTYIFKISYYESQHSLGTAVGLFKSVVGTICLCTSYFLANKLAGYRIF